MTVHFWEDAFCVTMVVAVGLLLAALFIDPHSRTCVEKSRVVSIAAINYRSATILLSNGTQVDVNQATLKPGDLWCTKWKQ